MAARHITGVSNSTAGFLGETERGPRAPELVTSITQFLRLFGGYRQGRAQIQLPYAVKGFFENGGKRCFVARVAAKDAKTAALRIDHPTPMLLSAQGPGTWGNRIAVAVDISRSGKTFRLRVRYWVGVRQGKATVEEVYERLSTAPASGRYFVQRINRHSNLVRVAIGPTRVRARAALKRPMFLKGGAEGGAISTADYRGRGNSGLAALEAIDEISIVCAPNAHKYKGLTRTIVRHCEQMRDRVAVLHLSPVKSDPRDLKPTVKSSYAAIYHPWLRVNDPATRRTVTVPPDGHVAGIYARADTRRGVHKAPANEVVKGVSDIAVGVTAAQQEVLNPRGINCIRHFAGRGIRVWGARTTSSDPNFKYVSIRRFLIFLEESIERGTRWAVFEANNRGLWTRVRNAVDQFLLNEWRAGALLGARSGEAFYVRCDETTMTQADIDNGRLIMLVGVAVLKPAEFVIFRIGQWTADAKH
jgi:phage tail sheath protein FI